jgi:hypothetical protein
MKKSLLLIVFVTIAFTSKAQSWAPMIGTYWYRTLASPPYCEDGYCKYEYYKDSLIAGNNCQTIRRYRYSNCWDGLHVGYDIQVYTYTTSNNVVLVNDYLSTSNVQTQAFDTLYYFNAPVGYKWITSPNSFVNCTGPKSQVTVVDTGHNVIQGVNLKWQKVSISTYYAGSTNTISIVDTIYERFGYLKVDVFNPYNFCTDNVDNVFSSTALRCYGDNQIINFKYKGLTYNCDYVLGIKESELQKNIIQVYPNPANDVLNFEYSYRDELTEQPSTIEITNTLGQLVLTKKMLNSHSSLNIQHLQSGVYYLELKSTNNVVRKKFIKE